MPSLSELQNALPASGLFRDSRDAFLLSPEPFPLSLKEKKELEKLGQILQRFQLACERIYRRSVSGKITPWISETLDYGKPEWLIDAQREGPQKDHHPKIIRPDLLLTKDGFRLTELDAVPGGLGVTAWLAAQYEGVIGGETGMLEGFRSLSKDGLDILVSEEAADYRPEMEWLAAQLSAKYEEQWSCTSAESYDFSSKAIYRFFELFDWESITEIKQLANREDVTPPLKPHFEEKLWLAFFWAPALKRIWEEELRGSHLRTLSELIPYGWVIDPSPLPPHAALPKLNVGSWDHVAALSQKERRMALKVSGFSELAWGSRGVTIGHDVSGAEWKKALGEAVNGFSEQPRIMQRFIETKVVRHPYFDRVTGEVREMEGRLRLCPYYFVEGQNVQLGGVLTTITPLDKKKIHGMSEAILVPAACRE